MRMSTSAFEEVMLRLGKEKPGRDRGSMPNAVLRYDVLEYNYLGQQSP